MDAMTWQIGLIIFLAAFTESLSGFGVALVAMALLPLIISIRLATPLVAVVSILVDFSVFLRYRQALDLRAIWRVALATLFGIPLGLYFLSHGDERLTLMLLGVVLTGYALYALLGKQLPPLEHPLWAYLAGFLGGLLGGAYNTFGPPVILYADSRAWPPKVFKSNLSGYFVLCSVVVLASHAMQGNLTPQVMGMFWPSLPFMLLGLLAGFSLDRWLKPAYFRRLVLLLLVAMGLRLCFN